MHVRRFRRITHTGKSRVVIWKQWNYSPLTFIMRVALKLRFKSQYYDWGTNGH